MDNEFMLERQAKLTRLLDKWAYLTEHLADPRMRSMVSQLLENQSRPVTSLFEVDSTTGNLPTAVFPSKIAFPAIVQTFPALAANALVQVAAMDAPRALVLYKRFIQSSGGTDLPHSGSWTQTAEGGAPPKARMKLDTLDLAVEKYMLSMEWTAELEEDAASLGNIDVQAELIVAMRDEVAAEIDGLVISDLFAAAASSDVTGPNGMVTVRGGAGNVNFSTSTFASYETPKAHEERLLDALIDLKVQIFNKSFRQPNFIVGNAAAVANIEKMQSFARQDVGAPQIILPGNAGGTAMGLGTATPTGVPLIGRLANQYDVYVSAQAPANKLLMGVRQAGFVLGLYRPYELTVPFYDNGTDSWIRGIRTRIARKLVDGAYFGTLTLS